MRLWKKSVLFYFGGMCYTTLELLWRGVSHWSMFLLGGCCFLILGQLGKYRERLTLVSRGVAAAGIITALELGCGLLVNRGFQVWDYRQMPLNFHGQICLPFSLLWVPLSLAAMVLYRWTDRKIVI